MTDKLDKIKQVMEALLRMPPKPHEDMKIHKPKRSEVRTPHIVPAMPAARMVLPHFSISLRTNVAK